MSEENKICGACIETKILQNVEVQANGIIRNSKGRLIARLVDDVDFNGEHIYEEITDLQEFKKEFIKEINKEVNRRFNDDGYEDTCLEGFEIINIMNKVGKEK